MKSLSLILIALLLSFTSVETTQAQTRPQTPPSQGIISGNVVDATSNEPIPAATVAVWNARDSSLVTGAVADEEGHFRIENLRPGSYYVKFSYIGFSTRTVEAVNVSPQKLTWQLGTVKLNEDTRQLAEVEVSSERPDVSFSADRTVYNTRNSMVAVGGNATDLLAQVPSVEVDNEGKVSLRGNENVAIHINGKPSPMTGDFLTAYLQQLPANSIDRIEVIPNPSAKYDPDGMAGILNIVLKQNTEIRGGGIMLGLGSRGEYNGSVNGNYQKNKISLFASYGLRSDNRNGEGNSWREYKFDTALPFLQQYSSEQNDMFGHNLTGGFEYSFTQKSTLSFNANASFFDRNSDNFNDYLTLDAGGATIDPYRRSATMDNAGNHQSYSTVFRRIVEPSRNEFSAEFRFSQFAMDNRNDWLYQILSPERVPIGGDSLSFSSTQNANRDFTGQFDWTYPLASRTTVEAGYKGVLRLINNDYTETNTSHNNEFNFNEQQHAVYGIVTQGIGKFDLQLGLRLEQATTNFELINTGDKYDNDYFSFFPSVNLSYKPSVGQQWKISYAKRISRPDGRMLNPFVPNDDPLNIFSGNPYLKPSYTHSFEGGYQMFSGSGSLGITPFYRRTVNAWTMIQTIGEDRVSRYTFENLNTNESYGIESNGGLRLGRKLSANVGVSVFKRVSDGSNVQNGLGVNTISWNFRTNIQAQVRPGLSVEGFWMFNPRQKTEQGYRSGFTRSSLGVRQQLMGNKLNLSVRVSDPFKQMSFSSETNTDRMFSTMNRYMDSRAVYVSLQYNFGKQSQRRNNPSRDENNGQQEPVTPSEMPMN